MAKELECPVCGRNFFAATSRQKYCSKVCYTKTEAARDSKRRYDKRWVMSGKSAEYQRIRIARLRQMWGRTRFTQKGKLDGHEAEEFVSSILPREGFDEILPLRSINKQFPIFDILAMKDGQDYAIQVTSDWRRKVPMKHLALCERLGLKYLLCFVKPGFSYYHFREGKYDSRKKTWSVVVPFSIIRRMASQAQPSST